MIRTRIHAIAFSLCALGLALGASACDQPDNSAPAQSERDHLLEDLSDGCTWVCNPCPPGQVCTQVCWEVGLCDSECGFELKCDPGFHFNEHLCECTPDAAATPCGLEAWCDVGEVCCNEGCGHCAPVDDPTCTTEYCPLVPPPEQCGDFICPPGTECCNDSCGICVEPGGSCTQQVCE